MSDLWDFYYSPEEEDRPPDPKEDDAEKHLYEFFSTKRDEVFYSRQVEVLHENSWYHWVTNRAIRRLISNGLLISEERELAAGNRIKLLWNRSYRYYKRDALNLIRLVEEYADPNIGSAIGLNGELLVLEGFATREFVTRGRNTRAFNGKVWTTTNHDLDFIFERDGVAYGVEVKNMLGYMDHDELKVKIAVCKEIGVRPLIVARMLPKSWVKEIVDAGGFALILKWQLYPYAHKELAKRVHVQLGLPVDAPRALHAGTVARFLDWHTRKL